MRAARIDAQGFGISAIAPAIPEPATVALTFAGLALLGLVRRTRNH